MTKKAGIVYCSPAGTTRHVAQVIENELKSRSADIITEDLAKGDGSEIISCIKTGEKPVLFIGSPVYAGRAIPPVMKFIADLPKDSGICAVPFVTWGYVSSGIALHDLGKALTEKGCVLLGAAKVGAVHSIMWSSDSPLGLGHPNADDDQMIRELVGKVLKKVNQSALSGINLSDLAYQPENLQTEMAKVTLEAAKGHMPQKAVDEKRCTKCGICAEVCPVQTITLSPLPAFGNDCICCFNCVRECPESAISADLAPLEKRIQDKAAKLAEQPFTKIFV
ncbi:MAG: EFR1 family ferrodoxin [Desulfococcaceae bacterium]